MGVLTSDISVLFKYGRNILAMAIWHRSKAIIFNARTPCIDLNPFLVGVANRELKFLLTANEFLMTHDILSIRWAERSTSAIYKKCTLNIKNVRKNNFIRTIKFVRCANCSLSEHHHAQNKYGHKKSHPIELYRFLW